MIMDSRASAGAPRVLYPEKRHPYYIVAPPYTRMSAGIKALHLLCHTLNRSGLNAFLWLDPAPRGAETGTHADLLTPRLTEAIVREHHREGRAPAVVYPETVSGNPLQAGIVVRYILNYPGLLGGDTKYAETDLVVAYAAKLAKAIGAPADHVLFVPTSDTRIFHPGPPRTRAGSCFFASKYLEFYKGTLLDITRNSLEITRNRPDSQTPEQIAELFRRCEVFYAYENTALAIEAMLCECPTVFLPNPHLTDVIAAEELGWDGFAWGTEPQEVARAKATVQQAHRNYLKTYDRYWEQLAHFVEITQRHGAGADYRQPVAKGLLRSALLTSLLAYRKPSRWLRIALYLGLLVVVALYF